MGKGFGVGEDTYWFGPIRLRPNSQQLCISRVVCAGILKFLYIVVSVGQPSGYNMLFARLDFCCRARPCEQKLANAVANLVMFSI